MLTFLQVSGFPVYGTAQPTEAALKSILEKLQGTKDSSAEADQAATHNVVWYNMRQEPVIYINGTPFAPRAPGRYDLFVICLVLYLYTYQLLL